jgi:hypothetical protein
MSEEPDVERLREDLDQIKEAMGIAEQYEGAGSIWLFFGLAVPVASALSQYVLIERLPGWYFSVIWFVVLGGGFGFYAAVTGQEYRPTRPSQGKPNLLAQFAIVYLAAIPLVVVAGAYTEGLGYVDETAMMFSIIAVMLGVAYGMLGSSMRAYRIRTRDRWIFYVGTVWMVALGVAVPQSALLEQWVYAAFGGLYFVYAIGAYVVLSRT